MSAGDALAVIQIIQTAVGKVKDNKHELESLSKRLQFIVQSLEDCRERDVIRGTDYEDSLSAVSELVTRTERVSRRMLKKSLGDRTWNAREITNDLKRLNEDSQAFLSVHTVKTLDLVQTAQTEQQNYLVSSVEEIIAKIAELDLAFSKYKPAPKVTRPSPATAVHEVPPTLTRGSWAGADLRKRAQPYMASSLRPAGNGQPKVAAPQPSSSQRGTIETLPAPGTMIQRREGTDHSHCPPTTGDGDNPMEESAILVDKLATANIFTLVVSGLSKRHGGPWDYGEAGVGGGDLEATFSVPGTAGLEEIKDLIERDGYQRPSGLIEDETVPIAVVDGVSAFDATAPGGLQISKDEPLLWWVDKYEEYHGITSPVPMKTEVEWTRNSLVVDGLTVRCHRTLRVPDAGEGSELPPDIGTFPFFPVDHIGSRAPKEMKQRGGFIMPMFRREALWISFESERSQPAVKISAGGVNVVSGASATDTSPLQHGRQDYIIAGRQPWIDGIVTGEGIVRQFVVTEMHQGYTVEEQVTGEATIAPSGGQAGPPLKPISATPAELRLKQQRVAYVRKQKLYSNNESTRMYNEQLAQRFHIHIVAPELWEDLTGILPPFTPVTRDMYMAFGIPWYKLFDDYVESITGVSEELSSVRSIGELDKLRIDSAEKEKDEDPAPALDPDAPPPCFQHRSSVSSCVFRPCGHAACPRCLGHALLGGSKCGCGSSIAKFVGMKHPLPRLDVAKESGEDSEDGVRHWTVQEIEQLSMHAVQHGKVVVIHRQEDHVAPLKQQDFSIPPEV